MILRGIIASPPVQGVTVQDPVDQGAPVGWSPVGAGGYWMANPSPNYAISALGTLNTTGNIDWSVAGYFSMTLTASATLTLTFATTATASLAAAAQVPSFDLGQVIKVRITSASGTAGTIVWPSTVTWVGTVTAGGGTHAAPLPVTGSVLIDVTLVCTGTGSAPTFDGIYTTAA